MSTTLIAHWGARLALSFIMLEGDVAFDARRQQLTITYLDGETEGLSVDLMSYGLGPYPGTCYIKDWSEREGLVDALVSTGVVIWLDYVEVGPFRSRAYRVRPLVGGGQ